MREASRSEKLRGETRAEVKMCYKKAQEIKAGSGTHHYPLFRKILEEDLTTQVVRQVTAAKR